MKDLDYYLSKTKKTNECLEWLGCVNTDGYPRVTRNGNSNGKLHRIIWELSHKKSPEGFVVRHTCDNIKCINPDHLILGTSIDNISDRVLRDRSQGLKLKDVEVIKHLYNTGVYNTKELASLFNVSRRTIYYSIKKGRNPKFVD